MEDEKRVMSKHQDLGLCSPGVEATLPGSLHGQRLKQGGLTDGQVDGWKEGRVNRWMDEQKEGGMEGKKEGKGRKKGRIDG